MEAAVSDRSVEHPAEEPDLDELLKWGRVVPRGAELDRQYAADFENEPGSLRRSLINAGLQDAVVRLEQHPGDFAGAPEIRRWVETQTAGVSRRPGESVEDYAFRVAAGKVVVLG